MNHSIACLFPAWFPAVLLAADFDPPAQLDIPSESSLKEAQTVVRNAFVVEYSSKKDEAKRALARDLLEEARKSEEGPAVRYVLLKEANRIAVEAGDFGTGVESLMDLWASFKVPLAKLLGETLEGIKGKIKDEAGRMGLAAEYALLSLLVSAEDFEEAQKAMNSALRYADLTKIKKVKARIQKQQDQLNALKRKYAPLKKCREALEKDPDDADSNLLAGKHSCFVRADWEKGFSLLAKGSDARLRSASAADTSAQTSSAVQAQAADEWWSLSEKEAWIEQYNLRCRAAFWYKKALPGLAGLQRKVAEERIAAGSVLPRVDLADLLLRSGWVVLFRSSNPALWNKKVNTAKELAIPLSECPRTIRFLRLLNTDTKEFVIIPMTYDGIGTSKKAGSSYWIGENALMFKGRHLGIARGPVIPRPLRPPHDIIIRIVKIGEEEYSGYGFGHVGGMGNDAQGFAWNGKAIPETVLEISVASRELLPEEMKFLLK